MGFTGFTGFRVKACIAGKCVPSGCVIALDKSSGIAMDIATIHPDSTVHAVLSVIEVLPPSHLRKFSLISLHVCAVIHARVPRAG